MDLTKNILKTFLQSTNIKDEYISILVQGIAEYRKAFTAPSIDADDNYEIYELLGDSTANEALVYYFYYLFPQLRCKNGPKIISRLKINYANTESFSKFAEEFNFLPYIKALPEELADLDKRAAIMEDVFEAFLGVTKILLAEHTGYVGVGNQIVYNIIKSLMDRRNILLSPEELYDTKTRLKEVFDRKNIRDQYGTLKYQYIDQPRKKVEIYFVFQGRPQKISEGFGNIRAVQEKEAAAKALKYLEERGVQTEKKFRLFCDLS